MKKILPFLFIFLLVLNCKSDETVNDETIDITPLLQAIIDEKVGNDADKLVGVAVSIRVGEEERWRLTGGISDLNVPIANNMRFGVASITKTIVAATTMKLIDEGVLSLNDRVDDWLVLENENVNNDATIFQLLSHSSGIYGYMFAELWEQAESNPNMSISTTQLSDFIGEPTNEPGIAHEYSNSNYLLLGMIIEAATGQTVGQVMREKFWTTLQLNNIYFGANENIQGTIATPWRDNDGNGTLEDISDDYGAAFHSIFYCAADIFTTASDLSMWAQHLYNGDAVSSQSRTMMTTTHYSIPDPVFTGYGLGTRINVYAGRTMYGHTGGMRGYGSAMFYDPVSKVSIAMLNNQSRSADGPLLRYELVEELLTVVYNNL